jgi:hypothetical protein
MTQKAERLFLLAQKIAEKTPLFFETKGPGRGDHATAEFMRNLQKAATGVFGKDYSEKNVLDEANLALDFFIPDEATAIEIALTLHLSRTEYELDIFKCLLAQESGYPVKRLLFIGKPGAIKRQTTPGARAIADFVARGFGLQVDIEELIPAESDLPGR